MVFFSFFYVKLNGFPSFELIQDLVPYHLS